jgi:hypothetical protein
MSTSPDFWLMPYRHVAPSDLEAWLEQKSQEGLRPDKLGQSSSLRMRLRRVEPATFRYVIDLQAAPRQDYFDTYRDAGWEHVGQMSSMHVWRQPYSGARPDAFTDAESLRARTRSVAVAVEASAALMVGAAVTLVLAALFAGQDAGDNVQLWVAGTLLGAAGLAIGFATVSILRSENR